MRKITFTEKAKLVQAAIDMMYTQLEFAEDVCTATNTKLPAKLVMARVLLNDLNIQISTDCNKENAKLQICALYEEYECVQHNG